MNPRGRRAAILGTLVAVLNLAACAHSPLRTADSQGQFAAGESLAGRIAVQVDGIEGSSARSMSASFELAGDANVGILSLATPLGSILAQARWSRDDVVLATPQGESRFPDMDALTRHVLGESIPVAAMFDWLRGRPWPGAASTASTNPDAPGFEQLGWVVDLARFDNARVTARRDRAPSVTVQARLDRP